jgi:hypothetical protein
MRISRRKLLLAAAVSASVQAPAQAPSTPQPDADLEAARSEQRLRSQNIARVPLPMTTEPAFQFKA